MRTVVFRFREVATWGVYVAFTASASLSERYPDSPDPIFDVNMNDVRLAGTALEALNSGFLLMEESFQRSFPRFSAQVTVHAVDFSLTDFQDEAVTAAVAMWVAEEFELKPVDVAVHYSPPLGRYVFEFR